MAPRLFRWLGPGGQDGSSLQGCSRAYFFTSGNAIETFHEASPVVTNVGFKIGAANVVLFSYAKLD
jgi:hypothetical protein